MERIFSSLEHGGIVRKGKRKLARPIDPSRSLHVTMRSSRARGEWSFLAPHNRGMVHLLVLDTAERYGIHIYKWQNVGNHIHLAIQGPSRRAIQAFLKVLPQRIMFAVTGARKGNPVGRFFDEIAHTRVVNWGREFKALLDYIWKNTLEALGFNREEIREMRANAKKLESG
jgi:hypothetical protein